MVQERPEEPARLTMGEGEDQGETEEQEQEEPEEKPAWYYEYCQQCRRRFVAYACPNPHCIADTPPFQGYALNTLYHLSLQMLSSSS